jgi:hypothetical protein
VVAPRPWPFSSSQAIIAAFASATPLPFRNSLLITAPSPVYAPSKSSGVSMVRTIGRSNVCAKSQSRSSWPGTAMIAPVP